MRKVHHPKIVQRADGSWVVVCSDCARDGASPPPADIEAPVPSLTLARALWENHYERVHKPVRRGA